jgi:hypothetical protein
MNRQGFKHEDYLKGFSVMIQQSSPTMRFLQVELMVLIQGSKGGEIHKKTIWFKILLENVIPRRKHRKEDLIVVTRL